jgi:hypothetical protein
MWLYSCFTATAGINTAATSKAAETKETDDPKEGKQDNCCKVTNTTGKLIDACMQPIQEKYADESYCSQKKSKTVFQWLLLSRLSLHHPLHILQRNHLGREYQVLECCCPIRLC